MGHELSVVTLPDAEAPPTLFANQIRDDLKQVYLQLLSGAKESILVIVYSLTDPVIINVLQKKAAEGISVAVICDAKASPHIAKKLGKEVSLVRRFGQGLMHQKIVVIDHKQTWIGSANLTTDSLQLHGNLVMAISGENFAKNIEAKAKAMDEEELLALIPHQTFSIKEQKLEMWFLPDNKDGSEAIARQLQAAEKTIRVAMFTWTRKDFAQEIVKAAKRGVKVEVVIDNNSAKGSSKNIAEYLAKQGIAVALGPSNVLLHHKFAYIDGKLLINGSANWTQAAFTQNDDCFVILHNLIEEQKSKMETLWQAIQQQSTPL